MLWFKILSVHGEEECLKLMRQRCVWQQKYWADYPEEKYEFVQRMALIATETWNEASGIAVQVMSLLGKAGYPVDMASFGDAVGFLQLSQEDKPYDHAGLVAALQKSLCCDSKTGASHGKQ